MQANQGHQLEINNKKIKRIEEALSIIDKSLADPKYDQQKPADNDAELVQAYERFKKIQSKQNQLLGAQQQIESQKIKLDQAE